MLSFYLPSEGGEKITLSTFILVSITFFVLLLYELIPVIIIIISFCLFVASSLIFNLNKPTSLQVPLIAKYTLFSFVLVSLSILASVVVLNVHFRSNLTHAMPNWTRIIFLNILPKFVLLKTPEFKPELSAFISMKDYIKSMAVYSFKTKLNYLHETEHEFRMSEKRRHFLAMSRLKEEKNKHGRSSFPDLREYQRFLYRKKAIKSVEDICEQKKKEREEKRIKAEWRYTAVRRNNWVED